MPIMQLVQGAEKKSFLVTESSFFLNGKPEVVLISRNLVYALGDFRNIQI